MDYIGIVKDKIKTIKLTFDIWKRLTQFKLDLDISTYEDAVSELLSDRGY